MQLLLIALFIVLVPLLWILLSLESRVISKIKKEARDLNLDIKVMRIPNSSDGACPFDEVIINKNGETKILGLRGNHIFNRILEVEKFNEKRKYWVRITTMNFRVKEPEFKRLE